MGSGRKGKRKGKKGAPEVRTFGKFEGEEPVWGVDQFEWMFSPGAGWGAKVEVTPPDVLPGKPGCLTLDQLEKVLGALQDGIGVPGRQDAELLADIVCELIERRKRDVKPKPLPIPVHPWRGSDAPSLSTWTLGDLGLIQQAREAEKAKTKKNPFREGTWESDLHSDELVLRAPDGTRLYSMSGLMVKQLRDRDPNALRSLLEKIRKQKMDEWRKSK